MKLSLIKYNREHGYFKMIITEVTIMISQSKIIFKLM